MIRAAITLLAATALLTGCSQMNANSGNRDFNGDVKFLAKHTKVVTLGTGDGPKVAVVPAWQGRVMTSTSGGKNGAGYGWINDELIFEGKTKPHIMPWGGEDRFWMGPEGGQYAIFFKPGDKFDLEHWQTPAVIDTQGYEVVSQNAHEVVFRHKTQFANYSGAKFNVQIDRTVRLLSEGDIRTLLGVQTGKDVRAVGYESENRISNIGNNAWEKTSGLLSVWILGMFKHSPTTTVTIPFNPGPESERGPIVNDTYFGKVPPDRLKVAAATIFFKGDGQMRTKIGVGPKRCKEFLGSYDPARNLLTIVNYTLPPGATDYVNSMWEMQKEPFGGDVVNSYNDGPPAPGAKPLGPFYELETSSPAAALKPGESLLHVHRTFHFEGPAKELDPIAKRLLGVGVDEIANSLK
ncbi:MAG: hypothetical protein HY269_01770 [Deltaproteobacteria bacterium]|nr:hypothetical protein [Deltaproteobacteria bacterium]